MPSRRRREKVSEQVRNLILVVVAVGLVIIFFNLDVLHKGESLFSKTSVQKLRFAGELNRKAYAPDEINRLVGFIKRYDDDIASLTLRTSVEDSYRAITPDTPVLFELRLEMTDGARIDTPVIRARRAALLPAVLAKLHKDMGTYRSMKRQGKDVNSLINIM